jgi:hypothetical protein
VAKKIMWSLATDCADFRRCFWNADSYDLYDFRGYSFQRRLLKSLNSVLSVAKKIMWSLATDCADFSGCFFGTLIPMIVMIIADIFSRRFSQTKKILLIRFICGKKKRTISAALSVSVVSSNR